MENDNKGLPAASASALEKKPDMPAPTKLIEPDDMDIINEAVNMLENKDKANYAIPNVIYDTSAAASLDFELPVDKALPKETINQLKNDYELNNADFLPLNYNPMQGNASSPDEIPLNRQSKKPISISNNNNVINLDAPLSSKNMHDPISVSPEFAETHKHKMPEDKTNMSYENSYSTTGLSNGDMDSKINLSSEGRQQMINSLDSLIRNERRLLGSDTNPGHGSEEKLANLEKSKSILEYIEMVNAQQADNKLSLLHGLKNFNRSLIVPLESHYMHMRGQMDESDILRYNKDLEEYKTRHNILEAMEKIELSKVSINTISNADVANSTSLEENPVKQMEIIKENAIAKIKEIQELLQPKERALNQIDAKLAAVAQQKANMLGTSISWTPDETEKFKKVNDRMDNLIKVHNRLAQEIMNSKREMAEAMVFVEATENNKLKVHVNFVEGKPIVNVVRNANALVDNEQESSAHSGAISSASSAQNPPTMKEILKDKVDAMVKDIRLLPETSQEIVQMVKEPSVLREWFSRDPVQKGAKIVAVAATTMIGVGAAFFFAGPAGVLFAGSAAGRYVKDLSKRAESKGRQKTMYVAVKDSIVYDAKKKMGLPVQPYHPALDIPSNYVQGVKSGLSDVVTQDFDKAKDLANLSYGAVRALYSRGFEGGKLYCKEQAAERVIVPLAEEFARRMTKYDKKNK